MNAQGIRHLAAGLVFGGLLLSLMTAPALAFTDSVMVESKTISGGADDTISVFVENSAELRGIVVPLVIREIDPGAYITALTLINPVSGSRLATALTDIQVKTEHPTEDGNCKSGQPGGFHTTQGETVDFASPDAVNFSNNVIFSAKLAPGSDFAGTGTGVPSYQLAVTVTATGGTFEVDTTCTNPANHISYVLSAGGSTVPSFTKGVITISTTGIHDISAGSGLPMEYSLGQNRPNPFNAGTVIEFTNLHAGHVTLDVFNILGQNVVTLIDKTLEPGTFAVDWDGRDAGGRNVSSGMYFYRLNTRDFTDVKKMVLLK